MRRIMYYVWCLLLLCGNVGCAVQSSAYYVRERRSTLPSPSTTTKRAAVVTAITPKLALQAEELVKNGTYPGVAIGIVLDQVLLWTYQAGTKNVETLEPISKDTCFRMASITKTFTALAVLALRDEGKLNLDESIAKTVPQANQWLRPTSDSPDISWRHLLTHTSGLPRVGPIDFTRTDVGPTADILENQLRVIQLVSSPGTETRYSNLGYAILGLAISKQTGRPYEDIIEEKFLTPLKMRNAGFSPTDCSDIAQGYRRTRGDSTTRFVRQADWKFGATSAVGGLYASTQAITQWLAYQMAAWPPRNGEEAHEVSRATRRESHRLGGFTHPGQPSFGLGWGIATFGRNRDVLASHSGSTWTWGASVRMLVDRNIGIIALGNSGGSAALSQFTIQALHLIDSELAEHGVARPPHSRARRSPIRQR